MSDTPRYLDGFLAAVQPRNGRAVVDAPPPEIQLEAATSVTPLQTPPAADEILSREEQIKRRLHPLDSFSRLLDCVEANRPPDSDDQFRLQWFGLFYQAPRQDAFLLRLRLPGGRLQAFQLVGLATITQEYTDGQIVLNPQGGVDIPGVPIRAAAAILRATESIGLSARQTGGDCVQSIRGGEYDGIFTHDLHASIYPLICGLEQALTHHRGLSDLPRACEIVFRTEGEPPAANRDGQIDAIMLQMVASTPSLVRGTGLCQDSSFLLVVPGDKKGGFLLPSSQAKEGCLKLLEAWAAGADRTSRQSAGFATFCAALGQKQIGDLLGKAEWQPLPFRANYQAKSPEGKTLSGFRIPGDRLLSGQLLLLEKIVRDQHLPEIRLARGCLYVAQAMDAATADAIDSVLSSK